MGEPRPTRSQSKDWEAKPCVPGSGFVHAAPKSRMSEPEVKAKLPWRPLEGRDVNNVGHLIRETQETGHKACSQEGHEEGPRKTM